MAEAFEGITGYEALSKPETFPLSILEIDEDNKPYWITRPDSSVERDGPIEGKATSFSTVLTSGNAIWDKLTEDTDSKKIKNNREKEWSQAHSHEN